MLGDVLFMRDKTLDRLRGFAMLQVIVVHVLYWGGFFVERNINFIKSFCLFEMPLFFFITGASSGFAEIKSYVGFVQKRYRKLLVPYWIFAVICALFSIINYSITTRRADWIFYLKVFLSWGLPLGRPLTSIPYLTWALWFIPVYLCVVLFIPTLQRLKSRFDIRGLLFLLPLFLGASILRLEQMQYILFYLLWTYAGLFYAELRIIVYDLFAKKQLLWGILFSLMLLAIAHMFGESLDMQQNKFPPNVIFLLYSFLVMSVICYFLPSLDFFLEKLDAMSVLNNVFHYFSRRSTTVFLYQVFAFNLTIPISKTLFPGEGLLISSVKAIFCLLITIPLCAIIARYFGKIEEKI